MYKSSIHLLKSGFFSSLFIFYTHIRKKGNLLCIVHGGFLRFCSSGLEKIFLLESKQKKFQGAVAVYISPVHNYKNMLLKVIVIFHIIKY